jgi:hypothetical protein
MPANGEELGRLASSLVGFTDAAFIGRTVIEMKPNTHGMFGTTFTAKYVDFVLRHDDTNLPFHSKVPSKDHRRLTYSLPITRSTVSRCPDRRSHFSKNLDWTERVNAVPGSHGARSRTRTGTDLSVLGILSPVCLPNSTIRAAIKNQSVNIILSSQSVAANENFQSTLLNKKRRQHERNCREQFDQHVQTGTRGIFKRIT